MNKQEMLRILGEPDAWGGTSRKYKKPSLFKYVELELHFDSVQDVCTSFTLKADKALDSMFPSAFNIVDWEILPGSLFSEVKKYLVASDIKIVFLEKEDVCLAPRIELESGVNIYFEEELDLYCFCFSMRE